MAKFLTTSGTSYHLENIITEAKKKLVLVSPYLKLSKTLLERIKDASDNNVEIIIIYGKDELKSQEFDKLSRISKLELYYFQNLHAKCYFNEVEMVITSMNMYESSEKQNREMGVYITRNDDSEIFRKAVDEAYSIIKSSEIIQISKSKKKYFENSTSYSKSGFCIRCSKQISYSPDKPYCYDCYSTWSFYENLEYEEKSCHSCGNYNNSTMLKPLCYKCYSRN